MSDQEYDTKTLDEANMFAAERFEDAEPGTTINEREVLRWRLVTRPATVRRKRMDGSIYERHTTRTDRVPVYAPRPRKPYKRLPEELVQLREDVRCKVRRCRDIEQLEQCMAILGVE